MRIRPALLLVTLAPVAAAGKPAAPGPASRLGPARAASAATAAAQADEGFIDANGVPIHYRSIGTGPAVVLLHGVGGRFDESRFRFLLDALRAGYRVIGVDVRGHGESGKPHEPAAYGEQLATDVIRVLDHLDVDDAHLVGYSMGGIIALDAVALHPDRFRSLTLLGEGWTSADELTAMAAAAEQLANTDTSAMPAAAREPYRRNDIRAIAALATAYPALAVDSAGIRRIDVPVLALLGSEDPRIERARRLRALLPATRLEVLPGRTHGSVIDDAGYARTIRAFLDDVETR